MDRLEDFSQHFSKGGDLTPAVTGKTFCRPVTVKAVVIDHECSYRQFFNQFREQLSAEAGEI
jgi:hypothetical protein